MTLSITRRKRISLSCNRPSAVFRSAMSSWSARLARSSSSVRSRTLDSSSSRFLRNSPAARPRSRSAALSTSPVVTTMLMNPSIRSRDSLSEASAPGPPVREDLGRRQRMAKNERHHPDRGGEGCAQGRQRDKFDDLLAALEAVGHADETPYQRRPGERLERVAGADESGCEPRGFDGEVDERGADPDPGPDAVSEREHRRKRDARRRPHGGGIAGRNCEQQR